MESVKMDKYDKISSLYDWLDSVYFSERGKNPRQVVMEMLPVGRARVLDLCCGTLQNTFAAAQERPELEIIGIDRSVEMLRAADMKLAVTGVKNVRLLCADGTNTRLPDGAFDCIVLGLVLHENSEDFNSALLGEARRLLRTGGSVIVIEWERQRGIRRRIKFAPLYLGERLSSGGFKAFYRADKGAYLDAHGFNTQRVEHCNYSVVLQASKSVNP